MPNVNMNPTSKDSKKFRKVKKEKIKKEKPVGSKTNSVGKSIAIVLSFGIALSAVAFVITQTQKEVDVLCYTRNMSVGDCITESDLTTVPMLKSKYITASQESHTMSDGQSYQGQIYYKASNKEAVIGKYITSATRSTDEVQVTELSNNPVESNPWYENIEDGQEIFTLDFSDDDVYSPLIFPGSTIRMRTIRMIPSQDAEKYRKEIEKKSEDSSNKDNKDTQISVIPSSLNTKDTDSTEPVAEITFDNLKVIDALNSDKESIFAIYKSLASMAPDVRQTYIKENKEKLRERVIPVKLVLVLNEKQANFISEFEKSEYNSIKYTVLKTKEEDELYTSFYSIANSIQAVTTGDDTLSNNSKGR